MDVEMLGASVWEETLHRRFREHLENEEEMLDEYREAARASGSPAFAYLAGIIIDDETRHHAQFADLAQTIRELVKLDDRVLTVPSLDRPANRDELLALTERLLAAEKADRRQLKDLAAELHDVRRTTPWRLIIELMEMDTKKHIHVLEFIEAWLRRS